MASCGEVVQSREGDWMIWTDENAWPPSYHGTGSEEYFNSGWCQFDRKAISGFATLRPGHPTVYSFHLNDAFQFQHGIRVVEEQMGLGKGGQLIHETHPLWSSTAYWYADRPTRVKAPPPVAKRLPVLQDNQGNWLYDKRNQCPGKQIERESESRGKSATVRKALARQYAEHFDPVAEGERDNAIYANANRLRENIGITEAEAGEILSEDPTMSPGRGAIKTKDKIHAIFIGIKEIRGKFVNVVPLRRLYMPEIGDKIILEG